MSHASAHYLPKLVFCWLALALNLRAGLAEAQSDATARALFQEGRKLIAAGQFAEACEKFEASEKLEPGIGTQFNLADCWERLGKTASAWALFLDVANRTKLAGQAERERVARERASALEPKLSYLTVTAAALPDGVELTRNGIRIEPAQLGVATPVDPGAQEIVARRAGYQDWSTKVELASEGQRLNVEVPPLEPAPVEEPVAPTPIPKAKPAEPSPAVMQPAPTAPATEADAGDSGNQRIMMYSLFGVGAVGLVAGTVFGVRVLDKTDALSQICPTRRDRCTASDISDYSTTRDEAVSARTTAYISYGLGSAALIAGAVLWLLEDDSQDSARDRTAPQLMAGPGEVGLGFGGEF